MFEPRRLKLITFVDDFNSYDRDVEGRVRERTVTLSPLEFGGNCRRRATSFDAFRFRRVLRMGPTTVPLTADATDAGPVGFVLFFVAPVAFTYDAARRRKKNLETRAVVLTVDISMGKKKTISNISVPKKNRVRAAAATPRARRTDVSVHRCYIGIGMSVTVRWGPDSGYRRHRRRRHRSP